MGSPSFLYSLASLSRTSSPCAPSFPSPRSLSPCFCSLSLRLHLNPASQIPSPPCGLPEAHVHQHPAPWLMRKKISPFSWGPFLIGHQGQADLPPSQVLMLQTALTFREAWTLRAGRHPTQGGRPFLAISSRRWPSLSLSTFLKGSEEEPCWVPGFLRGPG